MSIPVVVSRQVFDQALNSAKEVDRRRELEGLAAPLDATLRGRVEEAWGAIESALRDGFQFGKAKAQSVLEAAIGKVEQLVAGAGSRAADLQDALLARMQAFVHSFIQGALARVPTAIKVGGSSYTLTNVKYTQKLLVSGAIKTNLIELFSLASSGEIEIVADYSAGPETPVVSGSG